MWMLADREGGGVYHLRIWQYGAECDNVMLNKRIQFYFLLNNAIILKFVLYYTARQ